MFRLITWCKESLYELISQKAEILRKKGKDNQGARTDLLSTIDKRFNTQKEIAKDLNWFTGKVAMGATKTKT